MTKPVTRTEPWRRLGSTLALTASLGFALQPSFAAAQALESDPSAKAQAAPPPSAKTKKAAPKRTAADVSADELNRREAERTSATVTAQAVPPPAASIEAPTIAAIPPRAPVLTASLTPDVAIPASRPEAVVPPVAAEAVRPKVTESPAKPPQMAQARPTTPGSAQPPAPVPSTSGTPSTPPAPSPAMTGAPSRTFAQSQLVPTQQPTLTLEVNKGTAIKLSGAATTVFVAAPDIADVQVKSPTMIYVFAKKPGDTVLYAVDDQDRVLLNTIVSVTSPVSRMKTALDAEHPGNSINFGNQGESIVLSGTARSAVVAEDARRLALQHVSVSTRVINNIRIEAPNQVQLRVKIAEVRRDALKRMGVNWQNLGGLGLSTLIGPLNAGFAVSTASAVGGTASGAARLQAGNFDTLLDFLATNNQATILAEPNLVAMSGESASFLAGGEIPVISPQAGQTGSTFAVTYKQVGVSLSFTPTIVGDRINLKVAPEVSQLSTAGSINVPLTTTAVVTIPAVQTRRASTTIELGSGQSFAVAGLLQQSSQQDITKVPWLGDIPILGTLFKSDAYQRAETELVIIVTPYFVEPTNARLRTPLTGRVPPTDADRVLHQRTNHPTPPQRLAVGREAQGAGPSAGFKLD